MWYSFIRESIGVTMQKIYLRKAIPHFLYITLVSFNNLVLVRQIENLNKLDSTGIIKNYQFSVQDQLDCINMEKSKKTKQAKKVENPKVDMSLVFKLFEETKNVPYCEWEKSDFAGLKAKSFVHQEVIMKIVSELEIRSIQSFNKFNQSGYLLPNHEFEFLDCLEAKIAEIYWLKRVLAMDDIQHRLRFLRYLESSLNFLVKKLRCFKKDEVNIEAIFEVQKQIMANDPDAKDFLAIVDTCMTLERYE